MSSHSPPRWVDRILRRMLPGGVLGETILGDLHQEHREYVEAGRPLPGAWYAMVSLGLVFRYALERIRPSAPPINQAEEGDGFRGFRDFGHDMRLGLRLFRSTPVLSCAAALVIGLGIGLTTQVFSVMQGGMLSGLPVPNPETLFYIDWNRLESGRQSDESPVYDFASIRESFGSAETMAAFTTVTANLSDEEGVPERYYAAWVTGNALDVAGVPPLMGRSLRPDDDRPGAPAVTVLSHRVWRDRYGEAANLIGSSIRVNGTPTTVVGVMPEGYRFPFDEDLWIPLGFDPAGVVRQDGAERMQVFGRLKAGVTFEAARAELDRVSAVLASDFPHTNEGVTFGIDRFDHLHLPAEVRAAMWIMLLATLGVLAVACANVANLLLARASLRTREVALRSALGASRFRIARQYLGESAVLAILGGGVGLVLSLWGIRAYQQFTAGIVKPFWMDAELNTVALLYAGFATVMAALLAGLVPGIQASGLNVGETLKDRSRGSTGLRIGKTGSLLVSGEIAISCALLVTAGLMVRSMVNVGTIDLGFSAENVATAQVTIPNADPTERDLFFDRLSERLAEEPSVATVAYATHLPGLGAMNGVLSVEGVSYASDLDRPQAYIVGVSDQFFETVGVEPVEGRDFHSLEVRADHEDPVVLVSTSFADLHFPGGGAVGQRIRMGAGDSENPWRTVIGVVPDLHVGGGVGGLGDDRKTRERIYLPTGAMDRASFAIMVGLAGSDRGFLSALRRAVADVDPDLPIYDTTMLDVALYEATWFFRLFGASFLMFGVAALFIAAVGLYGVMAFSVRQRRKEIGIRKAIGAEPRSLLANVVAKGMTQVGIGLAIGAPVGGALGWSLQGILFGVDALDPVVYTSIIGVLAVTGALACLVPARAAAAVDPIETMKA